MVELPGGFEREQLSGLQLHGHVRQLEGHALELADLLTELDAVHGPLLRMLQRSLRTTEARSRHLQTRGAQPVVGYFKALVQLAENLRLVYAAVAEFQNAVVVTAVGNVLVPVAYGIARRALVDEEGRDELLLAARRLFFAGGGVKNDKVSFIGMTDEMLRAVDDEVVALRTRRALHATHVGTNTRLRHRHAVGTFATHGRQQITFALLALAGHQDVRRARHARPMQRVVGAAQLAFVKQPGERIEARTTHFRRHVGGVKPGLDGLGLDGIAQLRAQHARGFYFRFMGVELIDHEIARGLDDELLLFRQREIHGYFLRTCMTLPCCVGFSSFWCSAQMVDNGV